MSKQFYIFAILGLSLLIINFLIGSWTALNLNFTDFQNFYREYTIIEIPIIAYNLLTISWYCYRKKYWIALFSFILIDSYNLVNSIDWYSYITNGDTIMFSTDPSFHYYLNLILGATHFILIGTSSVRNNKWFLYYSTFGLLSHFLVALFKRNELFALQEIFIYISSVFSLFIILNYLDEIKLLNKKPSDNILDN